MLDQKRGADAFLDPLRNATDLCGWDVIQMTISAVRKLGGNFCFQAWADANTNSQVAVNIFRVHCKAGMRRH